MRHWAVESAIIAFPPACHPGELLSLWVAPVAPRYDYGPEYIDQAMAERACAPNGLSQVPQGSLCLRGYVESQHSRLRDQCVDIRSFCSALHTRVFIGDWEDERRTVRRLRRWAV
jgi:hypothetical protein